MVDEALGPILTWNSASQDPALRVAELIATGLPRIEAFEATFKAALKLSLDQWARGRAGTLGEEPEFKRGHRADLLKDALAPLEGKLPQAEFDRLAQALSLVFGVEVLTVLKDIWGLGSQETQSVAQWAANALVRAALKEDAAAMLTGSKAGLGRQLVRPDFAVSLRPGTGRDAEIIGNFLAHPCETR